MKLRTEMVDPGCGMSWEALLPGHYDAPLHMWAPAAHHDAMAAHALLQAMGEACASTWHDYRPSEEITGFIKQRAAEILAGWLREE